MFERPRHTRGLQELKECRKHLRHCHACRRPRVKCQRVIALLRRTHGARESAMLFNEIHLRAGQPADGRQTETDTPNGAGQMNGRTSCWSANSPQARKSEIGSSRWKPACFQPSPLSTNGGPPSVSDPKNATQKRFNSAESRSLTSSPWAIAPSGGSIVAKLSNIATSADVGLRGRWCPQGCGGWRAPPRSVVSHEIQMSSVSSSAIIRVQRTTHRK